MSEELFKEYGPREHEIKLANQSIIELAYLAKEMIEACLKSRRQMCQEQARCYQHCFYTCRDILESVDSDYLDLHPNLRGFYNETRELSSYDDYLSWVLPDRVKSLGEGEDASGRTKEKSRLDLSNTVEQAKERLEVIRTQIEGESGEGELFEIQQEVYHLGKIVQGLHSQISKQNNQRSVEKNLAAFKEQDIGEFEFTVKGSSFRWSTEYGLEQVQVCSIEDLL